MNKLFILAIPIIALLSSCTVISRTLVGNDFLGEDKVRRVVAYPGSTIQKNGKKYQLYDYYLRICSLNASDMEENCKDSLVLKNVDPETIR